MIIGSDGTVRAKLLRLKQLKNCADERGEGNPGEETMIFQHSDHVSRGGRRQTDIHCNIKRQGSLPLVSNGFELGQSTFHCLRVF